MTSLFYNDFMKQSLIKKVGHPSLEDRIKFVFTATRVKPLGFSITTGCKFMLKLDPLLLLETQRKVKANDEQYNSAFEYVVSKLCSRLNSQNSLVGLLVEHQWNWNQGRGSRAPYSRLSRLIFCCFFLLILLAYLSSYHEKATKRCTSSLRSC